MSWRSRGCTTGDLIDSLLLVYAALEYRIRQALKDDEATFPNQKGQRVQNPAARWVFHDVVGIHLLVAPGQ